MNYRQRVKIERRRKRKQLEQMFRHGLKSTLYDSDWLWPSLFERTKV